VAKHFLGKSFQKESTEKGPPRVKSKARSLGSGYSNRYQLLVGR